MQNTVEVRVNGDERLYADLIDALKKIGVSVKSQPLGRGQTLFTLTRVNPRRPCADQHGVSGDRLG